MEATTILLCRFGFGDTITHLFAVPREGEELYMDGETYKVSGIKYFPFGCGDISEYKKHKELRQTFVRVLLVKAA